MGWENDKKQLFAYASRFESITLVSKNHWFWRTIGDFLQILSIGSKEKFLTEYATTIGSIQAYPSAWSSSQVRDVIPHESRHTSQFRAFGLGVSPWLGVPIMGLFYIFFLFPVGLAWARYRLELDAEVQAWRYSLLYDTSTPEMILVRAQWGADQISSSAYGWAVPRKWARWGYERKARKVIAELKRPLNETS